MLVRVRKLKYLKGAKKKCKQVKRYTEGMIVQSQSKGGDLLAVIFAL